MLFQFHTKCRHLNEFKCTMGFRIPNNKSQNPICLWETEKKLFFNSPNYCGPQNFLYIEKEDFLFPHWFSSCLTYPCWGTRSEDHHFIYVRASKQAIWYSVVPPSDSTLGIRSLEPYRVRPAAIVWASFWTLWNHHSFVLHCTESPYRTSISAGTTVMDVEIHIVVLNYLAIGKSGCKSDFFWLVESILIDEMNHQGSSEHAFLLITSSTWPWRSFIRSLSLIYGWSDLLGLCKEALRISHSWKSHQN